VSTAAFFTQPGIPAPHAVTTNLRCRLLALYTLDFRGLVPRQKQDRLSFPLPDRYFTHHFQIEFSGRAEIILVLELSRIDKTTTSSYILHIIVAFGVLREDLNCRGISSDGVALSKHLQLFACSSRWSQFTVQCDEIRSGRSSKTGYLEMGWSV